ncbi:MAG TPA: hypothetical protein VK208_16045, partial [Pyrinomonadaceae bacterium]|nr:hypothetical protein [Pyrinomonadaceae bacterium]
SANQILVKIQDNASPITLQRKPDGSLFGEGTAQVNGRTIVGSTDDPENPFVFTPKIGRCSIGSLVQGGSPPNGGLMASSESPVSPIATPSAASVTPSAVSVTPAAASIISSAAPTTPTTTPSSAPSASPVVGSVSLAIASGFANQPGAGNPLGGKTVLVLKESLESILAKAGFAQPGSSMRALTAWARTCETGSPLCKAGIDAMRPYAVASAKLDGNGAFTFTNGRAGTFYLVLQTTYNGMHLVWDLRVDLKPGTNSVTFDQRNATPL